VAPPAAAASTTDRRLRTRSSSGAAGGSLRPSFRARDLVAAALATSSFPLRQPVARYPLSAWRDPGGVRESMRRQERLEAERSVTAQSRASCTRTLARLRSVARSAKTTQRTFALPVVTFGTISLCHADRADECWNDADAFRTEVSGQVSCQR
jgi:hypothetical protein